MFLMNRCWIVIAVASVVFGCGSKPGDGDSPDDTVFGVWRAVSYEIQGVEYEQDGLIMITPGYLMSNTVFDADGDTSLDANANSGPIQFEGNTIVIEQWMQLHWRTADTAGNFLNQGAVERIPYRLEDDLLIFEFPSGNRYVAERLAHISSR